MSKLSDVWNRLKDISGIKECVVCGDILSDVIANHSQKLTGLYLCYKHLKMYQQNRIDWDGDKYIEVE